VLAIANATDSAGMADPSRLVLALLAAEAGAVRPFAHRTAVSDIL
jgi:hypothetical protein